MDVSDRRLQVQLTPEAKIASDFSLVSAIFVFAGFVSALRTPREEASSAHIAQFSCGSSTRIFSVSS